MSAAPVTSHRGSRLDAEREFWNQHSQDLDETLKRYERGPERNTEALLNKLEPLDGATVLDFACGTGVTSAWLAARGARVTGVDIAPEAIETARHLCGTLGVEATFICADLAASHDELPVFDRVYGQQALHHVDVTRFAPILAEHLRPGGIGAFLETTYTNPLFRFARRFMVGRFGIHRIGTDDEQPVGRTEIETIRAAFGSLSLELGEMQFFRIINRNMFLFRHETLNRICERVDDAIARWPRLDWLSYHRGLVVTKPEASPGS
jgi:SAM-dependent methyltransferase